MNQTDKVSALRMEISSFKEILYSLQSLAIYDGDDRTRANYRFIANRFGLFFDKYLDEEYLLTDETEDTKA